MEKPLPDNILIKKYVPSAIIRFDKITKQIEKAEISIDIGCSIGVLTREIAGKSKLMVGLELRKDAIKIAKSISKKNQFFVIGNATYLPFKHSSFDQGVSSEVIEHIKDYGKYISETRRVLKKGSPFILTTPNRVINFPSIGSIPSPSITYFLGKITRNPLFLYPYGHYYGGFSPRQLKKELARNGFRVEKIDYCGFALVKLIDDFLYMFAVKKKKYDDISWFKDGNNAIGRYKRLVPLIKKIIKIDSAFLKLGMEGYIIFLKSRKR